MTLINKSRQLEFNKNVFHFTPTIANIGNSHKFDFFKHYSHFARNHTLTSVVLTRLTRITKFQHPDLNKNFFLTSHKKIFNVTNLHKNKIFLLYSHIENNDTSHNVFLTILTQIKEFWQLSWTTYFFILHKTIANMANLHKNNFFFTLFTLWKKCYVA